MYDTATGRHCRDIWRLLWLKLHATCELVYANDKLSEQINMDQSKKSPLVGFFRFRDHAKLFISTLSTTIAIFDFNSTIMHTHTSSHLHAYVQKTLLHFKMVEHIRISRSFFPFGHVSPYFIPSNLVLCAIC